MLYFGRLTKEKGIEVLFKAYNNLKYPKYRLRVVGHCTDSYRDYLLSLLDESHFEKVTISKPLQDNEMWEILRKSSFVIHPATWFENMPNSLVEALSAGKPLIASSIGSLPELILEGQNGYLVPPGDIELLTAAIYKMSEQADLTSMGNQSRLRYLKYHTPQTHVDKLQQLFKTLCSRNQIE
jgi:glycosyltransferase involved in cell wall biosynthesis